MRDTVRFCFTKSPHLPLAHHASRPAGSPQSRFLGSYSPSKSLKSSSIVLRSRTLCTMSFFPGGTRNLFHKGFFLLCGRCPVYMILTANLKKEVIERTAVSAFCKIPPCFRISIHRRSPPDCLAVFSEQAVPVIVSGRRTVRPGPCTPLQTDRLRFVPLPA